MTTEELQDWINVSALGPGDWESKGDRRRAWVHRMFALALAAEEFDLDELNPEMLVALLASAPFILISDDASKLQRAGRDVWAAVKAHWNTELGQTKELAANKNLK